MHTKFFEKRLIYAFFPGEWKVIMLFCRRALSVFKNSLVLMQKQIWGPYLRPIHTTLKSRSLRNTT